MTTRAGGRVATLLLAAICILGVSVAVAAAQGAFGVGRPSAPEQFGGPFGWLMAKQAAYYREFARLIRAAKANGSAVYGLLGLSFTYGIFHAAGPGHGKAVISSYLVANGETWRRGVVLSFASALLQALAAVAIVGIAAVLLGGTAKTMGNAVRVIEIGSYLVIIAVGLRLAWTKALGLATELRNWRSAELKREHEHHHHHKADAQSNPANLALHAGHDHDHGDHDRAHTCEACGHAHGPEPAELVGPDGWHRGLSAIVAVGLRPCSGAILVLVFALAQGLFWVGVASTFAMGVGTAITVAALATLALGASSLAVKLATMRTGIGGLAVRGIELCAALLVAAFGVLLLTGYMASERLFGA